MMKIILIVCAVLLSLNSEASILNIPRPRVCIIGAGVGGLSSARHLKEAGIDFVVLEATNYVGGTWRYDQRVGTDEFGLPIHTSMYKYLRTNLPKVAMELPKFPIPDNAPEFLTWDIYYDYLKAYTKHFGLEQYIKLLSQVTSVKRMKNNWKVSYKHIPTGKEIEDNFDYVIVATGHHSHPHMPMIPGEDAFKGTIIHSHDYREPDAYKCKRVLIIGAGASGMDIGLSIAAISKTLVHSHHARIKFRTPFPSNYIRKGDVKELNETGAIFADGSYEEIDDIIYCTGFEFNFPFLDESSGLTVSPRMITPLHKQVLNINQPTMFVLGTVNRACLVIALDAQARYATALVKGEFTPPSHDDMIRELEARYSDLRAVGRPLHHIHVLANKEDQYYAELSEESGIKRVKPVLSKIHAADTASIIENLYTYRNYVYTVLDDEKFTRILMDDRIPPRNVTCSAVP